MIDEEDMKTVTVETHRVDLNEKERREVEERSYQLPKSFTSMQDAKVGLKNKQHNDAAVAPMDHLYSEHVAMPDLTKPRYGQQDNAGHIVKVKKYTDHKQMHLVLELTKIELASDDQSGDSSIEAYVSLYNNQMKQFISEEYVVVVSAAGDVKSRDRMICFLDLLPTDMQDLHAVVRVHRVGGLHIERKVRKQALLSKLRRPMCVAIMPLPVNKINESLNVEDAVRMHTFIKTWDMPEHTADREFLHMQDLILKQKAGLEDLKENLDCGGLNYRFQIVPGKVSNIQKASGITDNLPFIRKYVFVPKLEFPFLRPEETRNYILVDLHSGDFSKSKGRNILLEVELRNADYECIGKSIIRGHGPMSRWEDVYRATVNWHENQPTWNERIRVKLPAIASWAGLHLHFLVSHCSSKGNEEAFAFAYLMLQGEESVTICDDKKYVLNCFKFSNKDGSKNQTYLMALQDDEEKRKFEDARGVQSKITVSTLLCSSRASQDETVGAILNWQAMPDHLLSKQLRVLGKTPVRPIFDLLPELIKTIFQILSSRQYGKPSHQIHKMALSTFLKLYSKMIAASLEQADKNHDVKQAQSQASVIGGGPQGINSSVPIRLIDYYVEPDFLGQLEYFLDETFNQELVYNAILPMFASLWQFVEAQVGLPVDMKQLKDQLSFQDIACASQTAGWLFRLLFRAFTVGVKVEIKDAPHAFEDLKEDLDKLLILLHSIIAAEEPIWLHTHMKGPMLFQFIIMYEICLRESLFSIQRVKQMVEIIVINSEKGCDVSKEYSCTRLQFLIRLVQYLSAPPKEGSEEARKEADADPDRALHRYHTDHNYTGANLLELGLFRPVLSALFDAIAYHVQDDRSMDEKVLACRLFSELMPVLMFHVRHTYEEDLANHRDVNSMNEEVALALNVLTPVSYFLVDILDAEEAGQTQERILSRLDAKMHKGKNIVQEACVSFLAIMSPPIMNKQRLTQTLATITHLTNVEKEKDYLIYLSDILTKLCVVSAFPKTWLLMRFKELVASYNFICWSGTHLIKNFLSTEAFDRDLHLAFTKLSMEFLLSPTLDTEKMPPKMKEFVTVHYGDMRVPSMHFYQMYWHYLGDHQLELLEVIVARLIELGQVENQKIAHIGRQMYFQLFIKEYKMKGNVKNFLFYTIDAVAKLASTYSGNVLDRYMDFFRIHLKIACDEHDDDIKNAGTKFLADVEALFDRLVELESLPHEKKYESDRSLRLIKLLEYLRERKKMDLYRKYAFYLCRMHKQLDNHVEIGQSMLLIAESHSFSDTELPPYKDDVFSFPAQSQTARKIQLWQRAIESFDRASYWEMSVAVNKMLQDAYESVVFNFPLLGQLHSKSAGYWQKILSTDRIFNAYYRIAFVGSAFEGMPVREYIYRSGNGTILESVRDFTMRMKDKWPDCFIENSSDLPRAKYMKGGAEHKERYVQITTLNCSTKEQMEKKASWYETQPLPASVRKYYENNDVSVWSFTRVDKSKQKKKEKGANEYRDLWIIRTFLVGELQLPSYSRVLDVTERYEVLIPPLENAVNVLNQKNDEMQQVIKRIQTRSQSGMDVKNELGPLSMNLSGVIDAAVMGGVAKYKEAFFDGSYVNEFPSHARFIPLFRSAMRHQVEILKTGLDVFGRHCQENLIPLYEHLTSTYRKMKTELTWMDDPLIDKQVAAAMAETEFFKNGGLEEKKSEQ